MPRSTTSQPNSSRKKKKTKRKATAKDPVKQTSNVDDIDAALHSLSTKVSTPGNPSSGISSHANQASSTESSLLSIDPHHLQVANEMRRVFGKAAFTADKEERSERRAQRAPGDSVGLAEMVSGPYAVGGPGLPAVLRRRNTFVQAKEAWPKNTSNGLIMEVEDKSEDGITTYRFVHTQSYKIAQLGFAQNVAIMDPMNMIMALRSNPYHVATLLQVSEVAKQEKDYATAGELLERALFAFGKSLHPNFAKSLAQGKARLDFRRPENREFYLSAWKYIGNIGMRATWRTAFEWGKLLLSLDPGNDPYRMSLMIDQLALRAGQHQNFLELARSRMFGERWRHLPNIRYSCSLAAHMAQKDSEESMKLLREAASGWPWIAARLCQQLDVPRIPPAIWGTGPGTEKDSLHCELYVTNAQDLWRTPNALSFLSNTLSKLAADETKDPVHDTELITRDEARYVILTDKPPLIGLLPKQFTESVDSMSDPLPPEDSVQDYELQVQSRGEDPEAMLQRSPRQFANELMTMQRQFQMLVPMLLGEDGDPGAEIGPLGELYDGLISQFRQGNAELTNRYQRYVAFSRALQAQPGSRLRLDGAELSMAPDGQSVQYRAADSEEEPTLFGLDPDNADRMERQIEEEMRALEAEAPARDEEDSSR